jgi:phage tail-like protein
MTTTTPHFLLGGSTDWRAEATDQLSITNNALTLQSLPGAFRPLVDDAGSFGGFQTAIGVAIDSQDRIYILDGTACQIKRFDPCLQQFVTLPCIGGSGNNPRQFFNPRGLSISKCDDLFVADTGNCRVQIFSLANLALRELLGPLQVQTSAIGVSVKPVEPEITPPQAPDCPPQVAFPTGTWQPWDVAVSKHLWTYVSDYANGLIHVFDPHRCWRTAFDGTGPNSPKLIKPTRITLDCEGRLYIIQENVSYVVVLNADGTWASNIQQSGDLAGHFCPVAVAVDVNGNLCLSDCVTRKTYFYFPTSPGSWCGYRCCGSIDAFAASLLFDRSGNAIYADGLRHVCQREPTAAFQTSGTFYSAALDSKTYQCVWHRVVLSANVPTGTAVRVDTFTAESAKDIDEITGLPESRWATGQIDTDTENRDWDCLVQSPPGRFLWLRLRLSGDGAASPIVCSAKVYFPRASSIQYLPAVYQSDPESSDFLARFLSIFDTLRGRTSGQIGTIAAYFDPKATPANPQNVGGTDFLAWLASWMGMSLENNWPVARRRELVRQAHKLYALRGTLAGLRLHIELYAGVPIRVLEDFRLRRWLFVNSSRLGDCSTVFADGIMNRLQLGSNSRIGSFQLIDYGDPSLDLFNAYANRFLVVVPRWPGAQESDQQTLQQIIELAKPAHTIGDLQWAEPRFRIGLQSFVGIDTVIGKYPVGVIEGQGKLGYDTVLGDPGKIRSATESRISETTCIGCNTILN